MPDRLAEFITNIINDLFQDHIINMDNAMFH
jgi:hypothetical protein